MDDATTKGVEERAERAGAAFAELVKIMARLRAPGGCPWDHKQTFDSIKPYLLEEAYEVMEAIDARDWPGLSDELGDLILQPIFLAEMAAEAGSFDICDSVNAINQKLIRRHPHVFGDAKAETPEDVKRHWDEIKLQEKGDVRQALLTAIPRNLPALVEADKLGHKAAGVGFEWPSVDGVLEKLSEEVEELAEAREARDQDAVEHELGDLFFTLVNMARFLKVDPEQALRKANTRFRQRFTFVEEAISADNSSFEATSLERMEELWQEGKRHLSAYNQSK